MHSDIIAAVSVSGGKTVCLLSCSVCLNAHWSFMNKARYGTCQTGEIAGVSGELGQQKGDNFNTKLIKKHLCTYPTLSFYFLTI